MSDGLEVTFEGMPQFDAGMADLSGPVSDTVARRALRAGWPCDAGCHLGSCPRAPGAAIVTTGPGKFTAHIARWVEFGHRLVAGGRLSISGRGKGHLQRIKATGKTETEADPFMRRAWESTEQVSLNAFQATVKTELDKLQTPGGK